MHKTMEETRARRVGLRRSPGMEPTLSAPAPEFAGLNTYASDPVLTAALDATLDEETEDELKAFGAYWGSGEAQEVARIANANTPTFRDMDCEGNRLDQVDMHPAYHALMNRSVTAGLTSSAWEEGEDRRQHRLRAATLYLTAQCERGHLAPISATHATVAALAYAPDLEAELYPLIASRRYDRRAIPLRDKEGAIATLAMSERGAGGATTNCRGETLGGDAVRLWGRKWMVAAPMGDIVLSLCLTQDGPTAVAIPRFDPENADAIRIERMLSLGGLASQAVVALGFDGAVGTLVGDPGRGFQVLRDVRTLTQLDAAVVMAGGMRGGLARAVHHARYHRRAGKALIDDPLHARVLSDLALECAAHTALAMRLASAFDMAFERDGDHAVARLVTPAARIYATKTAATFVSEAAELIGENTVLAEHPAARILADLIAYARWEGTTSEAALDIAAMVERDENVLREALDELGADLGDQHTDLVDEVRELGQAAGSDPSLARAFAEQLAMLAAASAMRRNLPRVVSDAYIATRLRERFRATYGALDGRLDAEAILDFIVPED